MAHFNHNQPFTHNFSEHDIYEFREAFNLLDPSGKGWIPTKQIGVVMRKLGQNPTEDALANIQNEVDPDGEGTVDFEMFLKCMAIATKSDMAAEEEDIKSAFRCFDKTPDGHIPADEFRYVMARLGEKVTNKEINEMLAAIDLDGDGQITLEEFKSKMMGHHFSLRPSPWDNNLFGFANELGDEGTLHEDEYERHV